MDTVMGLLGTILSFVFVLSIVVFIHEMGHFLVARFYRVTVESFSIGFGPEIVGWTDRQGTRWKVSWIPLGGYVKFLGDENAASMPSGDKLDELRQDETKSAGAFHLKPLYQRAAVVAAGPIANFILAIVIFMVLSMAVGLRFTSPRVDAVQPASPAAEAGFEPGDVITRVNGRSVDRFELIRQAERLNTGQPMRFEVERAGEMVELTATPNRIDFTDRFGNEHRIGDLGIHPRAEMAVIGRVEPGSAADTAGLRQGDWIRRIGDKEIYTFGDLRDAVVDNADTALIFEIDRAGRLERLTVTPAAAQVEIGDGETRTVGRLGVGAGYRDGDVAWERFGPIRAFGHGVDRTAGIITQTLSYIGGIFAGTQSTDQLGGPLRIAQISGQAASVSFLSLISLTALLSVSIGLINLFPVPMLDGGHLVYYAYEAVAGRPLSERAQEIGFQIGLVLVLALMVFATWNDLMHFKIFGNG